MALRAYGADGVAIPIVNNGLGDKPCDHVQLHPAMNDGVIGGQAWRVKRATSPPVPSTKCLVITATGWHCATR